MVTYLIFGLLLVLVVAGIVVKCYVKNCFSKAFSEVFSFEEDTSFEKEVIDQLTDRYDETPHILIN